MKYLSFKILSLCILLPPLLYIFSIQSLETHLKEKYTREIEQICTGNTGALFDGSIRLKDALHRNIGRYLGTRTLMSFGVKAVVTVRTRQGTLLYPAVFEETEIGSLLGSDPMQIAAENYGLMQEGLVVDVDVKLPHTALLSNMLLAFFILGALIILYVYFNLGTSKAREEENRKAREIQRLTALEKGYAANLETLNQERKNLTQEFERLRKNLAAEKLTASKTEDDMVEEIVKLEQELEYNKALQQAKEKESEALAQKIAEYEAEKPKDLQSKLRPSETAQKRFKTLYKSINMHEKAVHGFLQLPEDMKIKCEEVIHQLDQDAKLVPIKRKVFGKKNRETVLEVIFAYKGRLYFRNTNENKVEVLTIGTKHTQGKDLAFLDNL